VIVHVDAHGFGNDFRHARIRCITERTVDPARCEHRSGCRRYKTSARSIKHQNLPLPQDDRWSVILLTVQLIDI
jgi:hypothetical protein